MSVRDPPTSSIAMLMPSTASAPSAFDSSPTPNLALDPSGGPHNGGCGTCFGVVTVDPQSGRATPTADYYVLGQVTRFVEPGAVRIASNVAGNIWNVAFRNPDGSIVLLANDDDWGTGSQTFNVRLGANQFSYNLPAGAAATFVIPGSSGT